MPRVYDKSGRYHSTNWTRSKFPPIDYCPYHHSTSSTQVVCVLHHDFPLQRIVACVYTVTIPSGPYSLAHRRRALIVAAYSLSSPPSLRVVQGHWPSINPASVACVYTVTPPSLPLLSTCLLYVCVMAQSSFRSLIMPLQIL